MGELKLLNVIFSPPSTEYPVVTKSETALLSSEETFISYLKETSTSLKLNTKSK